MNMLTEIQNHLIERLEDENARLRDGIRQMFDNIAHERIARNHGTIPSTAIRIECEMSYHHFMASLQKPRTGTNRS